MLVLLNQSNSEIVKAVNKYEIAVIMEDLEFLKDLLEQTILNNEIKQQSGEKSIENLIFTEHNLIYFRDYYQKLQDLFYVYNKLIIIFLFELCNKIINLCAYFNNFSELNSYISKNIFTLFERINGLDITNDTILFNEISKIINSLPPPRKKLNRDLLNLKKIVIYELESVLNSNIPIDIRFKTV